jgi:hypothetical protein
MSLPELETLLESARTILSSARQSRERPLTDDKVLADWNGLAIAAFSRAARAFSERRYADVAGKAASFILGRMRSGDGGLLHRFRKGRAGIEGMAADYAFIVYGLTELYMATYRPDVLSAALELQRAFDTRFWDQKKSGYFSSPPENDDLLVRQKDFYDGAIPSASSVAFANLIRLSHLTGDTSFEKRADSLAKIYTPLLTRTPAAYTFFLSGLTTVFGPATSVVIVTGDDALVPDDMTRTLDHGFYPFTVVLRKTPCTAEDLSEIVPFTREMVPAGGMPSSFVCSGRSCSKPVTRVEELLSLVEK